MLRLMLERQDRGWSRAKVARRADLDQGLYGKIESGRVRPYPRELRRLARALGIRTDDAEALLEEVA
jgi:transcriptional regulator with XRE-family HTH domain